MLPLPLTFGLVPILIDLCKCRSSWICIFVSKPYVFVRTLLWQFDSQIDLPCLLCMWVKYRNLLYCYLEVHWIRTFNFWPCGFWAYPPHRLMFLYILVSPDLFPALTRLNIDFFLDWIVIEFFLGNTISLGGWIVIRTYSIPLIL